MNGVTALLFARGRKGDMNVKGVFLQRRLTRLCRLPPLYDALTCACGLTRAGRLALAAPAGT